MALLFMDSFDHYATADLTAKWTTVNPGGSNVSCGITTANGRRGSGSFRITNAAGFNGSLVCFLQKTLGPADPTAVVGVAVACSNAVVIGASGLPIVSLRDGGSPQLSLRLNTDLSLSVVRGANTGTVLGTTSSAALVQGVFAYVEWKSLIHPSAGTTEVRVNGVSLLALTAQNTRSTANTSWSGLALGPVEGNTFWGTTVTATLDWDDCYVLDGTGSGSLNSFLGDVRVDARYPTGAGATTGWTPSTGANWAAVDDAAPNSDTDYVATSTLNASDTYVTQDAPVPGAKIYGVQHCLNLKKMDAGTCTVAPVIRHSGVDYPGADLAPSTGYAYGLQIAAVNPGTGTTWSETEFNAAEFGVKKTT